MAQSPRIFANKNLPPEIRDLVADVNTALDKLFALIEDRYSTNLTDTLASAIGTTIQAHSDGLDDISALDKTDGNIIVGDGSNWVAESGATARTSLGVAIGSDVQAHGDVLDDLNTTGANSADGEFLVGTGAGALAWESGSTARASMGAAASGDVTASGLTVSSERLLGRKTTSTGAIEEIQIGQGLGLNGSKFLYWDADGHTYIGGSEQNADQTASSNGTFRIWMSDGTGSGDDGDLMISIKDGGGTEKTITLVDFSAF